MAATETKIENLEPLLCKTCVLKVSIHCQGCESKVRKVLRSIDGVYNISIDLRQQKVVVKGNVDGETLIKKLTKTGKRAELWPDEAVSKKKKKKKKKKKGKSENKEKQSDPEESSEESNQSDDNEGGNTTKNSEGCGDNVNKLGEGCAPGKRGVQFQELKPEVRQTVTLPGSNQPAVGEKRVSIAVQVRNETGAGNGKGGGGGGGGSGGKNKKKKKKQKNDAIEGVTVGGEHTGDVNQTHGLGHGPGPGPVPIMSPANESPPRHHIYRQRPPHYCAPAPPACTAGCCHTGYPTTSSYDAAYHTYPQPHSYAHVSEYESESYTSPPSDSFEFFSDENPNGCSIM